MNIIFLWGIEDSSRNDQMIFNGIPILQFRDIGQVTATNTLDSYIQSLIFNPRPLFIIVVML